MLTVLLTQTLLSTEHEHCGEAASLGTKPVYLPAFVSGVLCVLLFTTDASHHLVVILPSSGSHVPYVISFC